MLQQAFPDVALHFGAALDLHPLLLRLAQQRIVEAEAQATRYIRRADTCLVVVGRGTSDPDANSEIAKLCRMLEEGMGFGASFVCYSGTAKPSSPTACAPPRAWVSNASSYCHFCSSMAFS